jgi:phage tail sheath protein FI
MAFQLSPGTFVSEIDITTNVPAVATSVGGFVSNSQWGPVNEVTIISNELQLVDRFGKPDANTYADFFVAANFLSYSSDLRFARVVGTGSLNASSGTSLLIKNKTEYEANNTANTATAFHAKYSGAIGNSLKISMSDANTYSSWAYANNFISTPNTSITAAANGSSNDEIHIVVIDEDGKFTGAANTVLEQFAFASKASDSKNTDGTSNYYRDVLNSKSKYIWWTGHPAANVTGGTSSWGTPTTSAQAYAKLSANATYSLSGGVDTTVTDGNINSGYDLFANPDSSDVSLLITGNTVGTTIPNYVVAIAESRKDCLVFCSPDQSYVVNNFGSEATQVSTIATTKSSYAVYDSNYKYQYDKYNDVYRWIALNGDIAGLCARTDQERDPWFSPAGKQRGLIKNCIKLAWNPTKAERDTLYKNGFNPVVTFPGEGTMLYGDKTFLNRPSAFDRIGVRRLFITLEVAIAKASRSSLFDFNDEFSRAAFLNLVEPYLRDVKGRRGIYDFRVVCDTTNNTTEVIDSNQFIGDIYIKPSRSINFIQLNFVAVRTGVSFDEIVGKF